MKKNSSLHNNKWFTNLIQIVTIQYLVIDVPLLVLYKWTCVIPVSLIVPVPQAMLILCFFDQWQNWPDCQGIQTDGVVTINNTLFNTTNNGCLCATGITWWLGYSPCWTLAPERHLVCPSHQCPLGLQSPLRLLAPLHPDLPERYHQLPPCCRSNREGVVWKRARSLSQPKTPLISIFHKILENNQYMYTRR